MTLSKKNIELERLLLEKDEESKIRNFEILKLEAEVAKINSEMRQNSGWRIWFRPGAWTGLLPGVAALLTAFYAYNQGFFETESRKADLDRKEASIIAREQETDAKQNSIDLQLREIKLNEEIAGKESEVKKQREELARLRTDFEKNKAEIDKKLEAARIEIQDKEKILNELTNDKELAPVKTMLSQIQEIRETDDSFDLNESLYRALLDTLKTLDKNRAQVTLQEFLANTDDPRMAVQLDLVSYVVGLDEADKRLVKHVNEEAIDFRDFSTVSDLLENNQERLAAMLEDLELDLDKKYDSALYLRLLGNVCSGDECSEKILKIKELASETIIASYLVDIFREGRAPLSEFREINEYGENLFALYLHNKYQARLLYVNSLGKVINESDVSSIHYWFEDFGEDDGFPNETNFQQIVDWRDANKASFDELKKAYLSE